MLRTAPRFAVVGALLLAACADDGDDGDAADPSVASSDSTGDDAPSDSSAGSTPGETDSTDTDNTDTGSTDTDSSPDPTTATTAAPTTTSAPSELVVEFPAGELVVDEDDAFVATPSGVFYWHPDLLGPTPGTPVRLAAAPADSSVQGVAGVVDGAAIFGVCCDPTAGAISVAPGGAATATEIGSGSAPAISPDGTHLAIVGSRDVAVVDIGTGDGSSRRVGADELVPIDVVWGDAGPAVLADDDGEVVLVKLDPDALEFSAATSIGIDLDEETYVSFAGYGPDGELAVAHAADADDDVTLEAFDAATFEPVDALTRTLPVGVRSVRVNSAGDVLWVDEGAVWRTADGESAPLGSGAAAVWFAVPS